MKLYRRRRSSILHPDEVRFRHMLDATCEALAFISNRTRKDMESDRMLTLALIQLLEIIGEAANGISASSREKHAEIPWTSIVKMRNRLIHGYFDVDREIVWQTITDDLPLLQKQLEAIVKAFEE
jgi:uncharacterized protein with HEPN domain